MQKLVLVIVHPYSISGLSKWPPIGIERLIRNYGMKVCHESWRQALTKALAYVLHRTVIIQNHLFRAITGRTSAPDHFLCNLPCRRRPLELARRDSFLNQRAHYVSVASFAVRRLFWKRNMPCSVSVNSVQPLQQRIYECILEGSFLGIYQRGDLAIQRPTHHLTCDPYVLNGQAPGGNHAPERIPMPIPPLRCWSPFELLPERRSLVHSPSDASAVAV